LLNFSKPVGNRDRITNLQEIDFPKTTIFFEKNRLSLPKIPDMTFDNSRNIISLRIKLFGATVLFLAYIVLTYVAEMIKYPLIGLSDTAWTLILVALYSLVIFLPMILNYQYIYFSDDGEYIIFRYFTTGIVGGKKNSVEINKRTFSGYKTESKVFGLIKSITLFQKINQGVAKYPPVFISALNREQREKIFRSLNLYVPEA
jgi:hypothetical protein